MTSDRRKVTMPLNPALCAELVSSARWAEKVAPAESGCIQWVGAIGAHGYPIIRLPWLKMPGRAHRVALVASAGLDIAPGLTVDHLCRNTRCVNPAHLEAVTNEVNIKRAAQSRTHCSQGHKFTAESTYFRKDRPGHKHCRTCDIARKRARREAAAS